MYKHRFSVFTATYNRGHMLRTLYGDLLNQTFKDFEWVVVSDGSTDKTDEVMAEICDEGKLDIKFIKKANGGKHTAWREATKMFEGRYVVTADDDDRTSPDALATYNRYWLDLEQQPNYNQFWEVRTRCQDEDGNLVGKPLPQPFFDSDYNTVCYRMKWGGVEMNGCRKVEVIQNEAAVPDDFLFAAECSNFPEGLRWSRAARKYKTRFVPDITRIYQRSETSLCSSNKGKGRSKKKSYNTLIGAYYSLIEHRDLMFKYWKKKYFQSIAVVVYQCICLNRNFLKLKMPFVDKLFMTAAYLPLLAVYSIRR